MYLSVDDTHSYLHKCGFVCAANKNEDRRQGRQAAKYLPFTSVPGILHRPGPVSVEGKRSCAVPVGGAPYRLAYPAKLLAGMGDELTKVTVTLVYL